MKPGSGTTRLVHKASLDTTPTWKDLGYDAIADLLEEAVQEALSEEAKGDRDGSFELQPSEAFNHEVSHKVRTVRPFAAPLLLIAAILPSDPFRHSPHHFGQSS